MYLATVKIDRKIVVSHTPKTKGLSLLSYCSIKVGSTYHKSSSSVICSWSAMTCIEEIIYVLFSNKFIFFISVIKLFVFFFLTGDKHMSAPTLIFYYPDHEKEFCSLRGSDGGEEWSEGSDDDDDFSFMERYRYSNYYFIIFRSLLKISFLFSVK